MKILALLFLSLSFSWTAPFDEIIAVVGEEIILKSELDELENQIKAQQGESQLSKMGDQLRGQLLTKMIDEKVMLAVAERDTNILLTEEELDMRVRDQVSRAAAENGGELNFEAVLMQHLGMKLEDYKNTLKDRMRSQILVQKLQFKYVGQLEPSNQEVKEFFKEYKDSLPALLDNYKVSHLEVSIRANRALEKKAYRLCDSIIQLIKSGEDFAEMAKAHSDDPTGGEGGDIGFIKRGDVDPSYERAAFSLQVGAVSPRPVRSRFGYHAIKVTEKKDNKVKSSHVLVLVTPTSEDTAVTLKWLDSLKQDAEKNKTFAQIAKKISEDKATSEEGGSLGWFTLDKVNPNYKDIIEELEEGEISEPALLDGKYHLFRVDKKADTRNLNLEDDWTQISMLAKNYLYSKKLEDHLKRWKTEVHIEDRTVQSKKE